jgi:hypothetical protein
LEKKVIYEFESQIYFVFLLANLAFLCFCVSGGRMNRMGGKGEGEHQDHEGEKARKFKYIPRTFL